MFLFIIAVKVFVKGVQDCVSVDQGGGLLLSSEGGFRGLFLQLATGCQMDESPVTAHSLQQL